MNPSPADAHLQRFSTPILVAVIVLCFGRLLTCDFTWWDDSGTIHHNPLLNPPTFDSLRFYWTTPTAGLYVPVTYTLWIALAMVSGVDRPDDYGILLNPLMFHAANLLLHILSSYFVLLILRRLVRSEWPAFIGAALFALHPMQVETVAWISGMKDGLSWCFALATVLAFLKAADIQLRTGRPLWRSAYMPLTFLLLTLALLSKPSTMVTPAAILVLDMLLVRRVSLAKSLAALWPLFVLSLAAAVLARSAQYVHHIYHAPLWHRPFIATDAVWFYFRQLAWPATLTIDHGRRPQDVMQMPVVYVYFAIVLAVSIVLFRIRKSRPIIAAAGAIFVIGVAPVLGFTTFQMQYYSTVTEHYVYFSMLGPALAVAYLIQQSAGTSVRIVALVLVALLGVRTALQTAVWKDSFTLFGHAMESTPKSSMPYTNMGVMYMNMMTPRPDLAEPLLDKAYSIDPESFFALDAYGQVKLMVGKYDEGEKAFAALRRLIETNPEARAVNTELAMRVAHRWIVVGELDRADEWLRFAASFSPNDRSMLNAQSMVRKMRAERAATQPARSSTTGPAPDPASGPGQ